MQWTNTSLFPFLWTRFKYPGRKRNASLTTYVTFTAMFRISELDKEEDHGCTLVSRGQICSSKKQCTPWNDHNFSQIEPKCFSFHVGLSSRLVTAFEYELSALSNNTDGPVYIHDSLLDCFPQVYESDKDDCTSVQCFDKRWLRKTNEKWEWFRSTHPFEHFQQHIGRTCHTLTLKGRGRGRNSFRLFQFIVARLAKQNWNTTRYSSPGAAPPRSSSATTIVTEKF